MPTNILGEDLKTRILQTLHTRIVRWAPHRQLQPEDFLLMSGNSRSLEVGNWEVEPVILSLCYHVPTRTYGRLRTQVFEGVQVVGHPKRRLSAQDTIHIAISPELFEEIDEGIEHGDLGGEGAGAESDFVGT